MSDKKYIISKKRTNFTIIPNKVAQTLNYNLQALGLYIYLFSLPSDWEFYKSHLRKVCNLGVNKLNKLLRILESHNLVQIAQMRNDKGKFAHFEMLINDGELFKINDLTEHAQPYHGFCHAAETVTPLSAPIKNKNTKTISFKDNKDDITCASVDAREQSFIEFWDKYPKKKDKKRARKIWEKISPENIALILVDIELRKAKDPQWGNMQYIPHPSTYLNDERWTDDIQQYPITNNSTVKEVKEPFIRNNETRSTVPEYGPGHPHWEMMNKLQQGNYHAAQGSEAVRQTTNTQPTKSIRSDMRKVKDIIFQ